jgi:hypothetical protein
VHKTTCTPSSTESAIRRVWPPVLHTATSISCQQHTDRLSKLAAVATREHYTRTAACISSSTTGMRRMS